MRRFYLQDGVVACPYVLFLLLNSEMYFVLGDWSVTPLFEFFFLEHCIVSFVLESKRELRSLRVVCL